VATSASIRVVKQFTYRGVTRFFSNRYHFTNDAPTTPTRWTTFSDAVVTAEKAVYPSLANQGATIVETVGYAAGSEVPVFTKTYATDGTRSAATYFPSPGDVAGLVRYSTAARTSKNHPLYLFNYYHAVGTDGSGAHKDTWEAGGVSAMQTYVALWIAGFSDGTTTHVRCGPKGDVATGSLVEVLLTHRDLPR
jgi:hypothetical protein